MSLVAFIHTGDLLYLSNIKKGYLFHLSDIFVKNIDSNIHIYI